MPSLGVLLVKPLLKTSKRSTEQTYRLRLNGRHARGLVTVSQFEAIMLNTLHSGCTDLLSRSNVHHTIVESDVPAHNCKHNTWLGLLFHWKTCKAGSVQILSSVVCCTYCQRMQGMFEQYCAKVATACTVCSDDAFGPYKNFFRYRLSPCVSVSSPLVSC